MTARHRLAPLLAIGTLVTGCAHDVPIPPPNPPPLVIHESDAVRVTRLQTGHVAVKRRFREWSGPTVLRLPAILLDRQWTEWMPIRFYLVERNGRRIVFDTGETARVADPGHFDCDAVTGWFYRSQLRFAVAPTDELGPQLRLLDLEPSSVDTVVLSHLHSDHVGGLSHLPDATWMISATDADGHAGALPCRMPTHADTVMVRYEDEAFGAFPRSTRLTEDGAVRIVPTPGHSPGHQSVLIRDGERWVLLAADVVFDLLRLREAARRSKSVISASLADMPISGSRRRRLSSNRELTVDSTSRSEASMSSPRCDACASAMGLCMISSRDTSQSIAFFDPPGMPRTCSGLETITPSASRMAAQKASTEGGVTSPSLSCEKIGSSPRPSWTCMRALGRAASAIARSSAALLDSSTTRC